MKILAMVLLALVVLSGDSWAQQPVIVTHASPVPVLTTSTIVLAAATSPRRLLELVNISDTDVDCNLAGGTAGAGEGTRLKKNGGGRLYDIAVPQSAVNCIHAGSGSKTVLAGTGQ